MVEIPTNYSTRLCLVRHGETEWNAERRIQGQIDIGLNAIGRRQAEAVGCWLKTAKIGAIYSSDLQRAWLTAQAIGRALGLDPQARPALRERRYGIFEGLTYDEAKRDHPAGYAAFEGRNADYDFEHGESLKVMFERVTTALCEIVAGHPGGNVVVVVHGGVLDIVNRFVRGNGLDVPRDFLIPNAGLNWITCCDGAWSIERWGETAHLEPGALDELPS
ncbi:MAG: histidine phosphatase family protein [Betaproteobacteria bacterium HGW-Betaproteobacteria-7]|jgi:probable phosphoglycerate mutase|nr:MAG: histidine phosphatase family protein [Betaproteobacteria bacterium HGW-Betaproteobacteria-7]